jgi:hypothetical protein
LHAEGGEESGTQRGREVKGEDLQRASPPSLGYTNFWFYFCTNFWFCFLQLLVCGLSIQSGGKVTQQQPLSLKLIAMHTCVASTAFHTRFSAQANSRLHINIDQKKR